MPFFAQQISALCNSACLIKKVEQEVPLDNLSETVVGGHAIVKSHGGEASLGNRHHANFPCDYCGIVPAFWYARESMVLWLHNHLPPAVLSVYGQNTTYAKGGTIQH